MRDAEVQGRTHAVVRAADHPDPGRFPFVSSENLRGAVGRAIVDDDELQVPHRLSQHTLHRVRDEGLDVVRGHHDTDHRGLGLPLGGGDRLVDGHKMRFTGRHATGK